jgi:hypothetical protein
MPLEVASIREILALRFGAVCTHYALHSGTPGTTGNQLGSRVAIVWDSTTTVTTIIINGTTYDANRLDANILSIALAASTAAPYGGYWSASSAGTCYKTVALSIPAGAARNVDVDPSHYQV